MSGALVTGAGRGMGLEIARVLAARGLAVHVTDVDESAARSAVAEIGGDCWGSVLDVRDAAACREAAAATLERAGALEVWVNNAGILVTGFLWDHDETTIQTLFDVNTMGTINGTLAALEPMREAGRGHVVNIVSLAGLVAAPGEALYAATKHAAIAYSLGAAADLRRSGSKNVHVSAVCPDGVWTPMIADRLDDPDAAGSFSGKLLRPEEVAARVGELLDTPRPLVTIPAYRGATARIFDLFPRFTLRALPLFMADARRRQRRWKRRIESGKGP